MHAYCELALSAIKNYLKRGEVIPLSGLVPDLLEKRAGAFVSLHESDSHDLRGCIGTFLPTKLNLAEEIIFNAVAAATEDPRFVPVELMELPNLEINVDILGVPEDCELKELDPKIYGVIVSSGLRRGLLLPDLEGVSAVEDQLKIACSKAGIDSESQFSLQRFTVDRYK